MRYREHDENGDYVFTGNPLFLVDNREAVAQAIESRMHLYVNEWFLDKREGLDLGNILGFHTANLRDIEIKRRILNTEGVQTLISYESTILGGRSFRVNVSVHSIYGPITITRDYQP